MLLGAVASTAVLALSGSAAVLGGNPSTFTDPPNDSRSAPDIISTTVSNDAAGRLTFHVALGNRTQLGPGDEGLLIAIDADRNKSTGVAPYGIDYEMVVTTVEGYTCFMLSASNGEFSLTSPGSLSCSGSQRAEVVQIDRGDLGGTAAFDFGVGTFTGATEDSDIAPDGPPAQLWTYGVELPAPPLPAQTGLLAVPEPPPSLPPPVGRVLVQVSGNGTVTRAEGAARTTSGRLDEPPGVAQIDCGTSSYSCYAETAPGASVTMRATPDPGYQFSGWTGACSGKATCTLAAGAASSAAATFLPAGRPPAKLALQAPRFRVRWKASVGSGSLLLRGSLNGAASLRVELRRPHGAPLLARTITRKAGRFSAALRLPKRLAGGAKLLPGGFVVVVRATAKGSGLPFQLRTVTLAAAPEGVVREAFASASQGGPALRRLDRGAKEAWATFQFEKQPRRAPITVTWYRPNGRRLGKRTKNNRPVITTGIGAEGGIAPGRYRVDLAAGGKTVKRLNVTVG